MKTLRNVFYALATSALLFLMSIASHDAHAADGTIYFTGSIVAAPYDLFFLDAPNSTVASTVRGLASAAGPAAGIAFIRQRTDRPSGTVRVDAVGNQVLKTAFTDASGLSHAVPPDGGAIGLDGGTLSVTAQQPSGAGRTAALVTVSYN